MKYIKTYESTSEYLLCVKSTDPDFYWKFTKGKKYKLYRSRAHGERVKDNNNKFCRIGHWHKEKVDGVIYEYRYADGILTRDNSLEEYEMRKEMDKYNL